MSTWTTLMRVARSQLGDPNGMRWTNDQLIDYFVEAEERACRDGYLLRATDTVTISADTSEYDYPTGAIDILRMSWGGNTKPMEHKSVTGADRSMPGWDQGTKEGEPRVWITGKVTKKFSVYRTPTATEVAESPTLTLTIVTLPSSQPGIAEFRDNSTTPEIEPEHHFELIDFVKYRAHLQDTEAGGADKAAKDLAIFDTNMNKAKREALRQRGAVSTAFPGSRANL